MTRVKRGIISLKRRRNVLKATKGYRIGRSKKETQAKTAISHAGAHAFNHRRDKKGDFRRLWNIRINAGVREHSTTYSKFIDMLNKKSIKLDRKILSGLAQNHPDTFKRVVEKAS